MVEGGKTDPEEAMVSSVKKRKRKSIAGGIFSYILYIYIQYLCYFFDIVLTREREREREALTLFFRFFNVKFFHMLIFFVLLRLCWKKKQWKDSMSLRVQSN